MSVTEDLVNRQFRLAGRPIGLPTESDWRRTTEPVPALRDGGVLVKTLALSLAAISARTAGVVRAFLRRPTIIMSFSLRLSVVQSGHAGPPVP